MKPGKKKIMVQLWGQLFTAFSRDLRTLHIRRDPYLNDLLKREIQELAAEIQFKNSDEVFQRLTSRTLPGRVKVTLELEEELIDQMDKILSERNIPRDSFINRVLFFLLAKETHLNALGLTFETESPNSGKPFEEVKQFLLDPFWHIRSENNGAFYSIPCFPDSEWRGFPNLFSLNTAIDDDQWRQMNTTLADLSMEFNLLEKSG